MPAEGSSAAAPVSSDLEAPLPGARHALILLLLINLFNYLDRQVLASVETSVRREFFAEEIDPETGKIKEQARQKGMKAFFTSPKGQMGLLATAFLVTYMLAAPIFGWLATRMRRWLLVGIAVILWSLASGASGLATTYLAMFLTRCLVGIGEAVYGPVAPDILSDLYPVKRRGQILAWFYAAIPVGGALGYALGAQLLGAGYSWRSAFYVVVPPGLLLGIWCFLLPEPPRGQANSRKATLADNLILLKTPSYVLDTLGMTGMTFAMGGLAFWVPAYLEERAVPAVLGVEPATVFGAVTVLTGLAATLLGGIVGDRLLPRYPGSYFLVSGAAMVVGFPLLLLMIYAPFPLAWLPLAGFVFCLFFNTGPSNTILANVAHPQLRPAGFALNILVIHLFGDALSPFVIGALADYYNFDLAFKVVSASVLIGGLLWLWGARYLQRDTELAPTRLPAA